MRLALPLFALLLAALLLVLVRADSNGASAFALGASASAEASADERASPAALERSDAEGGLAPGEAPTTSTRQEATDAPGAEGDLWLSGRTIDEEGAPIVGAKVTLQHDSLYRRTKSGDDGSFELFGPPRASGVSAGALLRITGDDGFWDEGRYLSDQVRLGDELGDVVVPGRSRVQWTTAGDVALGGFGNGFRFARVRDADEPSIRAPSLPGGWEALGDRADVRSFRQTQLPRGSSGESLEIVAWRPLFEDGRGIAYSLDPGRYELRFEVQIDRLRYTEPLAKFELAEGDRVDLGRISLDAAFDWRRITLLLDGDPLAAGAEVLVGSSMRPFDEFDLSGTRRVRVDAGGALRLPLPHGRDGETAIQTLLVRLVSDEQDGLADPRRAWIQDPRSESAASFGVQPPTGGLLHGNEALQRSELQEAPR